MIHPSISAGLWVILMGVMAWLIYDLYKAEECLALRIKLDTERNRESAEKLAQCAEEDRECLFAVIGDHYERAERDLKILDKKGCLGD